VSAWTGQATRADALPPLAVFLVGGRAQLACPTVLTARSTQQCVNQWVKAAMVKTNAQGRELFCRRDKIDVLMVFLIWEGTVSCRGSAPGTTANWASQPSPWPPDMHVCTQPVPTTGWERDSLQHTSLHAQVWRCVPPRGSAGGRRLHGHVQMDWEVHLPLPGPGK